MGTVFRTGAQTGARKYRADKSSGIYSQTIRLASRIIVCPVFPRDFLIAVPSSFLATDIPKIVAGPALHRPPGILRPLPFRAYLARGHLVCGRKRLAEPVVIHWQTAGIVLMFSSLGISTLFWLMLKIVGRDPPGSRVGCAVLVFREVNTHG